MNNSQIAEVFETIAYLLEMRGEKVFTIRAYQRAARTIERLPTEMEQMLREEKDLKEIPGIGQAISDKITELVSTDKLGYYEKLKAEFPEGVPRANAHPRPWPQDHRKTVERDWRYQGIRA